MPWAVCSTAHLVHATPLWSFVQSNCLCGQAESGETFGMSFISACSQTVLETTGFLYAFNKYHVIHPSAELQCPVQAEAVSWPVYLLPPTHQLFTASRVIEGGKKKAINRREAEDDELREPPLIFHFDRLSSVKRQRRCSSYTELGSSLFVAQTYVFRMN